MSYSIFKSGGHTVDNTYDRPNFLYCMIDMGGLETKWRNFDSTTVIATLFGIL
jgi:hypothetical protein